jgi:hypothetical protein
MRLNWVRVCSGEQNDLEGASLCLGRAAANVKRRSGMGPLRIIIGLKWIWVKLCLGLMERREPERLAGREGSWHSEHDVPPSKWQTK